MPMTIYDLTRAIEERDPPQGQPACAQGAAGQGDARRAHPLGAASAGRAVKRFGLLRELQGEIERVIWVVTFLAILEMAKRQRLRVEQNEPFPRFSSARSTYPNCRPPEHDASDQEQPFDDRGRLRLRRGAERAAHSLCRERRRRRRGETAPEADVAEDEADEAGDDAAGDDAPLNMTILKGRGSGRGDEVRQGGDGGPDLFEHGTVDGECSTWRRWARR